MFSTVVNVLLPANRFRYSYDMTTNIATPLKALVGARVSVVSGPQKVSHHAQIEKRTKLESEPTRAAEWKTEETAQTYRDAWESTNTPDGRRELLSGSAIRFVLRSSKPVLDWGLEGP